MLIFTNDDDDDDDDKKMLFLDDSPSRSIVKWIQRLPIVRCIAAYYEGPQYNVLTQTSYQQNAQSKSERQT